MVQVCPLGDDQRRVPRCRWAGPGAPWARATNNVKKPHSQMCESCRKIFVKQNRHIFDFCHIFDSEACYCTKKVLTGKQK